MFTCIFPGFARFTRFFGGLIGLTGSIGFCFEALGLFSNLRVCTIYRSSFGGFTLTPNNLTFRGLI